VDRSSRQSGLTLVEVAIVVVIVGMLVGSVLKTQELVFEARVRATFDMSRDFAAAIDAYRDRYGALPGDDREAAARFASHVPVPVGGDGDGRIDGRVAPCGPQAHGEGCQLFVHLRAAGLVSGPDAAGARTPFGGSAVIVPAAYMDAGTDGDLVFALHNVGVTHRIAAAIDAVFDDGDPTRGAFRCRNLAAYDRSAPHATVPDWCSLRL